MVHSRTVEHHAQVVRRRGPLAREVKLAVGALRLVYEHDTLAELDGRPQLELVVVRAKRKGEGSEPAQETCCFVDLRSPARKAGTLCPCSGRGESSSSLQRPLASPVSGGEAVSTRETERGRGRGRGRGLLTALVRSSALLSSHEQKPRRCSSNSSVAT